MDSYINYQEFYDKDSLQAVTDILQENNIKYIVSYPTEKDNLVLLNNKPKPLILKIREEDMEKVDGLLFDISVESEYLYSFSDKDIIDIIANPNDWTAYEIRLATRISKQRKLKIEAKDIRSARTERKEEKKTEERNSDTKVRKNALGWLLGAGLLSFMGTISEVMLNLKLPVVKLGLPELMDGILFTEPNKIHSLVLSGIVSCTFLSLWFYMKQDRKWAYLVVMTLYSIDLFICLLFGYWYAVFLHLLVLGFLSSGYNVLLKNLKSVNENTKT